MTESRFEYWGLTKVEVMGIGCRMLVMDQLYRCGWWWPLERRIVWIVVSCVA